VVGDIHGMEESLQFVASSAFCYLSQVSSRSLLMTLSYDPQTDELIHVGDLVAKGTTQGSLSVLEYMASRNITGVRGNHDQEVIEWRSWINWLSDDPEGNIWLNDMERKWILAQKSGIEIKPWLDRERQNHRKWWKGAPDPRKMYGEHFQIAREMTWKQYNYLSSLPLILHVPSAHTYIVHAGLLSSDPNPELPRQQPLAHIPSSTDDTVLEGNHTMLLRYLQEVALLNDVPQNKDPWVVLNMRGVLSDGMVTK
jgi:hypothetical protein